jgi:tetratricopeptide (TPR) repeat protein
LDLWQDYYNELNPGDPGACLKIGEVYHAMGRYDAAFETLAPCVRQDPRNADLRALLGDVHLARGDLDAAERAYRDALAIARERADLAAALAELAGLKGRTGEALSRFAELAGRGTDARERIDASLDLADLLRSGGRFREAARVLAARERDLAGEKVREALAFSIRGLCALDGGDTAAARRLIERAINRVPAGMPQTTYLFARGLLELRLSQAGAARYTAAEIRRLARPASDSGRAEKAAAYLEGMALFAEGRAEEAVSALERVVKLSGHEYAVYRLGLARALLAGGRLAEARAAAEQASRRPGHLDPRIDRQFDLDLDRSRALLVLAEIESQAGRPQDAAAAAMRFLDRWRQADLERPETARARALRAAVGTPTS